jgi:hypothetical protein
MYKIILKKTKEFIYDDIILNFLPLKSKLSRQDFKFRKEEFKLKRKIKIYFLWITLII